MHRFYTPSTSICGSFAAFGGDKCKMPMSSSAVRPRECAYVVQDIFQSNDICCPGRWWSSWLYYPLSAYLSLKVSSLESARTLMALSVCVSTSLGSYRLLCVARSLCPGSSAVAALGRPVCTACMFPECPASWHSCAVLGADRTAFLGPKALCLSFLCHMALMSVSGGCRAPYLSLVRVTWHSPNMITGEKFLSD